MKDKIQALLDKEIEAIRAIPFDEQLVSIVDLIHQKVHIKDGKVVVSGVGKAGLMGMKISATLSATGTPSVYLSPLDAQHGDLGMIQKGDILFVLSNSGETREMLELVQLARNFRPDISIISMTAKPESTLATTADFVLLTGKTEEICPLGLTPTVSTTVMTVIGDILVVFLMEKIGLTKKEFVLRHHSGYLGQKIRNEE